MVPGHGPGTRATARGRARRSGRSPRSPGARSGGRRGRCASRESRAGRPGPSTPAARTDQRAGPVRDARCSRGGCAARARRPGLRGGRPQVAGRGGIVAAGPPRSAPAPRAARPASVPGERRILGRTARRRVRRRRVQEKHTDRPPGPRCRKPARAGRRPRRRGRPLPRSSPSRAVAPVHLSVGRSARVPRPGPPRARAPSDPGTGSRPRHGGPRAGSGRPVR